MDTKFKKSYLTGHHVLCDIPNNTTAQESTDRTHWCSFLSGSPRKAYTLKLGNEDLSVYCSMNGEEFGNCVGGEWTLVMKINNKQVMQTCWGLQNAIN